jgi:hypothetical protein
MLLQVWERGLGQQPVQRALALLAATSPDTEPEELARLSIGQRDARLLSLREQTFGPRIASVATCPNCGEGLELNLEVDELRAASEGEPAAVLSLNAAGYETQFRLPNSLDLIAIASGHEQADHRRVVLARCLLSASQNGEGRSFEQLPAEVLDAIVEEMGRADPQADIRLGLSCPSCSHRWSMPFDIVSYFWSELNAWASRALREVHILASAYKWHEKDILALSPLRRQIYLQMVGG